MSENFGNRSTILNSSENQYLNKTHITGNEEDDSGKTYQMRPKLSEKFKAGEIKEIIRRVLLNHLRGKNYGSCEEIRILTKEIADEVNQTVRDLNMRRYKHVVTVAIGQESGSGYRYIARCRWDAECDNQVSDVYSNSSLFCVCTVFGIYMY